MESMPPKKGNVHGFIHCARPRGAMSRTLSTVSPSVCRLCLKRGTTGTDRTTDSRPSTARPRVGESSRDQMPDTRSEHLEHLQTTKSLKRTSKAGPGAAQWHPASASMLESPFALRTARDCIGFANMHCDLRWLPTAWNNYRTADSSIDSKRHGGTARHFRPARLSGQAGGVGPVPAPKSDSLLRGHRAGGKVARFHRTGKS